MACPSVSNITNLSKKDVFTCLLIVFGIMSVFGFGISVIVIYSNGMKFETTQYPYPDFSSIQTYTAKKEIINTRWTYNLDVPGFTGQIKQKCPTHNHDADLYINDKLVARTDRKTLDVNQLNYILDGTGKTIFQVKTGDFAETLLNGNRIIISLGIYDPNGKFIGYYSGQNFIIQNSITIKDINGNNVIQMDRTPDPVWKWTVTLLNNTTPFNDFRLGALLAGYVSFSDGSKSNDICNNYFWITSWVLVGMVCFGFVGVISVIYAKYCKNGKICPSNESNNQNSLV
jgi:hypothetical protein